MTAGIIPLDDSLAIARTLGEILNEHDAGTWTMGTKQDDVHMDVEATVIERLGMTTGEWACYPWHLTLGVNQD